MNDMTKNLVLSLNLCHCLMEKKLLSQQEWEDIECQRTSGEKLHTLIWKYLSKRGPRSLKEFCDALDALDPPNEYLSCLIRERRETFVTRADDLKVQ